GITWHLYDRENPVSNVALENALLYRPPNSNDKLPGSSYRGVTRVRILVADGYVWFLTQFATGGAVRTLLLRAPYDQSTDWGINGTLEAWRGDKSQWQPVTDSVLPDEFDDGEIASDLYPPIVSMSDITQVQGERFVGLLPSASHIDYVLSNDLVSWTPPKPLRSSVPYFADDRGYPGSVVDPTLIEDASSTLHLFMASADGDSDHGIIRDGVRDCSSSPSYLGLGIYEGIVDLAPIVNTSISITPRANPAATGVVAFDVRVSATNGTQPNGRVTLSVGAFTATVDVNNGQATVFAPLNTPSTYPVHATFTSFGPWQTSSTDSQITVVQGAPAKKRAVRH
ncbi:MAG TPA: Ig-like domain-containing protein, partial [Thermoanaerobaculia bacterium]